MRTVLTFIGVIAASAVATVSAADDKKTCRDAYVAAQTLRDQHQLVEARDQLRTCARKECAPSMRGQMVKDCTDWLAQVEAALPSIVFDVKDGNGNDLSAVKVTMDGQPFAEKLDGSGLPIDPGEHRFTFDDVDGLAHSEKTLVMHEGEKDRHVSVALGAPSGAAPAAATLPAAASVSDGSTQRTIGLVVGGVGVAGVVVGSIFGGMALSGSPCSSNSKTCATQADHDTLVAHETIANIGLGVGLVGLVVGGYLFLTAHPTTSTKEPASASVAPWIGWGAAGVTGRF